MPRSAHRIQSQFSRSHGWHPATECLPNRGRAPEKVKKFLTETCHHVNMLKCVEVILLNNTHFF